MTLSQKSSFPPRFSMALKRAVSSTHDETKKRKGGRCSLPTMAQEGGGASGNIFLPFSPSEKPGRRTTTRYHISTPLAAW